MVVLAEHDAVSGAGLAAVFFVLDVVDVALGGAAVAAAGPGAAFVAGDGGFADGVGDGVGVADVEDGPFGFGGLAGQAAAQRGGRGAGAGDEPDRAAGEGVLQGLPGLGRQGGSGGGAGVVVGVGDQGDHLGDEVPVGAAGHDRDDEGVAADRLGVLAGQVAVLAGAGAEPGVLDDRRAARAQQVPQRS